MKLGVALSGCDIGGVAAYRVLEELKLLGLRISMISASSLPCVTALPYARGCGRKRLDKLAARFCRDVGDGDLDTAIGNLAASAKGGRTGGDECIPFVLNAYNLGDGAAVAFTDDFVLNSAPIRTLPMGDLYDMFSATVSGVDSLGSYRMPGRLSLCDYSARYGCPTAPLRMMGMERVLSIAFLPKTPVNAYEALIRQVTGERCPTANIHVVIEFEQAWPPEPGQYIETALGRLREALEGELDRLLF